MKPKIAVVTGGFEAEKVISYKSAQEVFDHLNPDKYDKYLIDIRQEGWFIKDTDQPVDKNDFSITLNGQKITFDCCMLILHGSPVEDGLIQGYFEMLNIPYTNGDTQSMAVTMDKILTKKIVLSSTQIKTARFVELKRSNTIDKTALTALGYPLFVKPNSVGSSFGVSKVKTEGDLQSAIDKAFEHDTSILIEEFIQGREFSQGVIQVDGVTQVLSPTEIISENEFFDFEAKYMGKSKEVTPADLPPDVLKRMTEHTAEIFNLFKCRDFARVDYLLRGNDIYFIEINTVPGLSRESLLPQQLRYAGISFEQFVDNVLKNNLKSI